MSSRMRVVVGVDRSEGSRAALRHAAQEAGARGVELVVIHAFEPPFENAHGSEAAKVLRAAGLQQATELLDEVLTLARAARTWAVERVTARPVLGEASAVLTDAVHEGDLLVVGTNRGSVVRRLLYGSVSSRVVRSAKCPVVVVPAPRGHADRHHRRRTAQPGRAFMADASR